MERKIAERQVDLRFEKIGGIDDHEGRKGED